jgi:hypothetical protein
LPALSLVLQGSLKRWPVNMLTNGMQIFGLQRIFWSVPQFPLSDCEGWRKSVDPLPISKGGRAVYVHKISGTRAKENALYQKKFLCFWDRGGGQFTMWTLECTNFISNFEFLCIFHHLRQGVEKCPMQKTVF